MYWTAYITVFLIAATKFLFAPSTAIAFGLSFWETLIVVSIGGIVGVTFFYFSAGFIGRYFYRRRLKKEAELCKQGLPINRKKVFTPFRRKIIRIKHSFGLIGIAIVTPCIISIPIGSIIAARFYYHKKRTVFVLYLSVIVWAFILTEFNDIVRNLFGG